MMRVWQAGCASAFAAATCAAGAIAGTNGSPIIAGFNLQRGGVTAINTDAAWLTQLRAAIIDEYPGIEFRGVATLTTSSLTGADLVVLTSTFSGGGPIVPLSAPEINALRAYVVGGGAAMLFIDGDTPAGWDAANESLLNAFGMDAAGTAGPSSTIDLTISASPITSGQFGAVASVSFTTGGRIDVLGPGALAAGVYAGTNQTAIAYLPSDAIAAGSGPVVVFGDTTMILDGFFTPSNRIAVMNTIVAAIGFGCTADFDRSGEVAVPDIFAFLTVWFAGDIERANYNRDEFLNAADVFAFLADWFAGC